MKKFFQNIKFKKISLTTLALALVVSGFLVWGNTEAAITGITVTSPNGGEIWSGSHDITWTTEPSEDAETVNIYLLVEGESSSIATEEANDGSYSWNTTAHADGSSYKIKIASSNPDPDVYSESANVFTIDNTPPTVESVSVNDESIAEGDVGTDKFVVTVNFTDTNPMDMVTNPAITFDPTLDTTITNCSNSWIDSNTFTYTCDIADADIESADIDIQVSGAKDAAGNTMSGTFTESDKFDVDTIAPTVTATISPSTGTAKVGDTITATLTAGESQADLNFSGTCTINGVDVTDSFGNNSDGTYTLSYEIAEGNTDRASGALPVSCTLAETSGNTVTLSSFGANALVVDANSPTVTSITFDDTALKIGETATVTIVMSEAVTGFDNTDVTTPNGTLGELSTGDDITFTGTFTPAASIEAPTNVATVGTGFTDVAGNSASAGATSANYEIDTVAPAAPAITSIATDDKINDSEKEAVVIIGTAEAGATINGLLTGSGTDVTVSGTADGSGNFSITVDASGLSDGTLSLSITATDAAGNVSTAGTSSAEKDTAAPVISTVTSNAIGAGVLKVGDTITFTVTMNATEDGLTIAPTVYNGGTLEWSTADSGATYTATYTVVEGQIDQGTALQLTGVTATDTFGNTSSPATNGIDVVKTIDANSPTVTSITFNDTALKIGDTATVTIVMSEAVTGFDKTDVTTPNGTLGDLSTSNDITFTGTFTPAASIEAPTNVATVGTGFTDVAGNSASAGATSANYEIDTVAPTGYSVTFDQAYVNNANKAAISFTFAGAEANATYNYSIDDTNGDTPAVTGTGTISTATDKITGIDVSTLGDETLTITVTLTDPAGNVGAGVTDTIVKKTVAPVISTVTSNATVAGILKVGDTITFTVTMNAPEDGLVIAPTTYSGGTLEWSTANSGATYTATYTIVEGQTDQSTALQLEGVTATDTFGNTSSPATNGIDVVKTIDANSPDAPVITSIAGDNKINDSEKEAVVIVGTTEANATIGGSLTGTGDSVTVSGTADGSGNFSITVDASGLADGTLSLSITATDAAGNVSTASVAEEITLDQGIPTIGSVALGGDEYINATDVTGVNIVINTTGVEDSQTVSCVVSDGTTSLGAVTGTISSGAVTIASGSLSTLAEGLLTVTCDVSDAAGNPATAGTDTATKDTVAPSAPGITSVAGDNKINDSEKTAVIIVGTAEAGATINGLLTGSGTDVTVSGSADGSGNFSITVDASGLSDGTLSLSITATDAAGNVSTAGTSSAVKDIIAPTVTSIVFDDTALKIGDTATVTIVMSEAVTGFDKDDVTAPNGTLGDLSTENNITFTGTFTPNASTEDTTNVAVVGTGFTDVALNPALTSAGATSANYAIDTLGPRRGSRSTTTTTTTVTDPITTPTTPTAPTAPTPYFFSTTMRIGSYAGEVLPLQQFLASKGYFTDTLNGYFGQTTFLAVKAYQKANGLGDDGIVGPMTRSVLNGAQNPSVPSGPTTPLTPSAYTYNFGTKLLMNGSRGDDVKELQRFLNKALGLGLVEDGILGPKTIGVIKEWQKSQGLKDDGIVGPLTKAKMLELAKGFK